MNISVLLFIILGFWIFVLQSRMKHLEKMMVSLKLGMTLADGTKVYELVDTGIMLKMSISGTKYWRDDALN